MQGIAEQHNTKFLCITLDEKLSWNENVDNVCTGVRIHGKVD